MRYAKGREMKLRVKCTKTSEVLGEIEFSDVGGFEIEFDNRDAERNPLNNQALTKDELKFGMNVQLVHVDGDGHPKTTEATIVGHAFRRRDDIFYRGMEKSYDDGWMITVATIDERGSLIEEIWNLTDMGVTPFKPLHDGDPTRWSKVNCVIALPEPK